MELRRWTNPHQPQTLQIAVFLLYLRAVFTLIFGSIYVFYGAIGVILAVAGMVLGGLGIANEKRWGYNVAVIVTAAGLLPLLVVLVREGPGVLVDFDFLLLALFPVAQFALLVHPMSREHQRIWFT